MRSIIGRTNYTSREKVSVFSGSVSTTFVLDCWFGYVRNLYDNKH